MASEKFRYQLRQEAEQWREEGLIDSEIYEQLATRYQLDELDSASGDRFIMIVLGVGFILLGLGVITFVAANWQTWSRPIRVVLLLGLFVGTNCAGFYLWRSLNGRKSRLGQGLLLLGALSLGANIGLMSQMFHQTGSAYLLYLVWGFGVWVMAYSLRLTSLGLMAIILMAIAYYLGFFRGIRSEQVLQMPLIISFLFIPLAYSCRSGLLFGLSLVSIVFTLGCNLAYYTNIGDLSSSSFVSPLILVLMPSLLWSYRDRLFFANSDLNFDFVNRNLAVLYLGSLFYCCSFNIWKNNHDSTQPGKWIDLAPWSLLIAPTFFILLSIWGWWKLGQRRNSSLPWRLDRNSTYIGATLIFLFILFWFNLAVSPIGIAGTIIFNLLLFSLAIFLIHHSVKEGQRFNFWLGIILIALQIFSRMFEYDTGLMFKAMQRVGRVSCG